MNTITKQPISSLGYNFILPKYIPKGKDEYYLRNIQHRVSTKYRRLKPDERKKLKANSNTSDNWDNVYVSEIFDPSLIRNCKFYGYIRIGKLEPYFTEFKNLRMPVGLYNSTIISCDFGDNVVVDNVNFMSHYIVGNEVILANINELATTDIAKFGNGVLKKGEPESIRIWMEICNENGGRSVLPFNGMLAGDAWLWAKYREDEKLMNFFKDFTDKKFDTRRGYYGKIGDRTVIKNCGIIKDVWVGSDAYIKGANKLKNLTINSGPDARSQIGEGCELVNGIIGHGCRIFYGVKAVRFILASNSQLKYGARLINSYLGDNSTISCCEVLNSLIFPAHEQHHNNSFLCAAVVMGQSNLAAGATIGSNHNSRSADGEISAGRGFWPGLCVSLKHNSKFASFTLIAKGDFPAELNIPIPFSLVSNDISNDELKVMPGYWFLYNMYALARNASKYVSRDNRLDKTQEIEYDFLAPDSVNELFEGLDHLRLFTAQSHLRKSKKDPNHNHVSDAQLIKKGEEILQGGPVEVDKAEIYAHGFENTDRKTRILKTGEAYIIFKRLIKYYGVTQIIDFIDHYQIDSWEKLIRKLPMSPEREAWKNIGGQLMPAKALTQLIRSIRTGKIDSWDSVHAFYHQKSGTYKEEKFKHAFASLLEVLKINPSRFTKKLFGQLLDEAVLTKEWMVKGIYDSRAKDYKSPFRQMLYETQVEMDKVIGKLKDNSFILQQQQELSQFKSGVQRIKTLLTPQYSSQFP